MNVASFEKDHNNLLHNCRVLEDTGVCRIAYAVCRKDDEYGYRVLSNVLFTMADAFEYACGVARRDFDWRGYTDFILVEDTGVWWDMDREVREDWDYAELEIHQYIYGSDHVYSPVSLFAKSVVK